MGAFYHVGLWSQSGASLPLPTVAWQKGFLPEWLGDILVFTLDIDQSVMYLSLDVEKHLYLNLEPWRLSKIRVSLLYAHD